MARGRNSQELGLRADPISDPLSFRLLWPSLTLEQRRSYKFPKNLDYADLSNLDFEGADLSHCSLYEANICGTDFVGANLKEADLRSVEYNLATSIEMHDGLKLDPEFEAHIKEFARYFPRERKLIQEIKSHKYLLQENDEFRIFTWADNTASFDSPLYGGVDFDVYRTGQLIPARSEYRKNGQGQWELSKEIYYSQGKISDPKQRGVFDPAICSWDEDGTITYEHYELGKPISRQAQPITLIAGAASVITEAQKALIPFDNQFAKAIWNRWPYKTIVHPDGTCVNHFKVFNDITEAIIEYKETDGAIRGVAKVVHGGDISKEVLIEGQAGQSLLVKMSKQFKTDHGHEIIHDVYDTRSVKRIGISGLSELEVLERRVEEYNQEGDLEVRTCYVDARITETAILEWKMMEIEYLDSEGKLHLEGEPALRVFDKDQELIRAEYFKHGKRVEH